MSESLEIGSKFKTTAVGIVATGKPTWGEWECALSVTASIVKGSQFWLGDLLNYGESKFGQKYSQAVNELGFDPGYLRNLAYTCGRVKLSFRNDKLSFSHHVAVAPCEPEDQKRWLDRAEENRWTVQQLRDAMAGENGENPGDVEESAGDDELSAIVEEITDYLDGLDDNHARAAAIRSMFRTLKSLAQKYKEGE